MGSGGDFAGGVFATLTMDAAMVLAARLAPGTLASELIGPELVGRWAAGLSRGRWRHVTSRPSRRCAASCGSDSPRTTLPASR